MKYQSLAKLATCHPNKKHVAKGLCGSCYHKDPVIRERRRLRHRRWVDANAGRVKHYHRYWVYGIDKTQYEAMLAGQQFRCAICYETFSKDHVDHDHKCCPGERSCGRCVRGLLCEDCNRGLGSFHDDPVALLNAIEYLLKER